jgi:PE-PPE domain
MEGSTLGKHCKPATKKWGRYVTTGVALEAATLLAFAYATDSHVPGASLLAQTSIFVDGTKSITGNEEGVPFFRMADSFKGGYTQPVADDNVFIEYPRSLGPLTGLGDPTYDDSEGLATDEIVKAVAKARAENPNPNDTIYVVAYSQGAGAAANAIPILEQMGLNENVQFVLASNPRRNDGGILTRLPAGVYVPVLGVSFGGGTTPTDPDTKVLQVTKQYDGVADAPDYIFNVAADANALLGFYYLHSGYYKDVPLVDPANPPAGAIVSTSPDGTITDVLLVAPEGELPLTMPLLALGVPKDVVVALDPFLRSIIETGYSRPVGEGAYPTEPVPFQLVPPPDRWTSDAQSVAAGLTETLRRLAALGQPTVPGLAGAGGNQALLREGSSVPLIQQPQAPEDVTPPVEDRPILTPLRYALGQPTVPGLAGAGGNQALLRVGFSVPLIQQPQAPEDVTPPVEDRPILTPLRDALVIGTGPNKVEPPKAPLGGWKPGALVRSIRPARPGPQSSTTAGGTAPNPLSSLQKALSSLPNPFKPKSGADDPNPTGVTAGSSSTPSS